MISKDRLFIKLKASCAGKGEVARARKSLWAVHPSQRIRRFFDTAFALPVPPSRRTPLFLYSSIH
jgi:hypothetical protein